MIRQHVGPASLKEKVKVFVCGKILYLLPSVIQCSSYAIVLLGPPGQVAAVAGQKAGMKQGELGGILKELGYTEDQVRGF